jgi:hypothetical protein
MRFVVSLASIIQGQADPSSTINKWRESDGVYLLAGNALWVKHYQDGRAIRESTGKTKESEAKQFLKEREGRAATGQPIIRRADRISYKEVAKDLREHYQMTGSRNMEEAEYRLKRLDTFFAG